jgi:transcriptional regulator with XRE-family HTH domain
VNVLGKRIRELRISKGMTQMQLAKRMGYIGNSRIASWEKGENIPSPSNLKRLSQIFEVDLFEYINNNIPTLDITIARAIKECKKNNLGVVDTVKELDNGNFITKENEKDILKAVLFGKWVTDIGSNSSDLYKLEKDE